MAKADFIFWTLKLTKLSFTQLALSKSSLKEEIVSILDDSLMLIDGILGNSVEECKVESSANECIGLDVTERWSLIKIRNRVGDNTQP